MSGRTPLGECLRARREGLKPCDAGLPAHGRRRVPGLRRLLDSWRATPAFVLGPAFDVLAHNALAAALHGGFRRFDNPARMVFLDPAGRAFHQDRARAAHSCVPEMRSAYGHDPDSRRFTEVVETLRAKSGDFAELWSRPTSSWSSTRPSRAAPPRPPSRNSVPAAEAGGPWVGAPHPG
ncbi:hypothetical protein ACFXGI_06100 [Streptomyces sp. NPDC059355]|uniref:MmyB family transcriptional regulator n=1 Tax=Streptomyces sp. NPDC059355 TaxID=3346811 RepID=UPI00368158AC